MVETEHPKIALQMKSTRATSFNAFNFPLLRSIKIASVAPRLGIPNNRMA